LLDVFPPIQQNKSGSLGERIARGVISPATNPRRMQGASALEILTNTPAVANVDSRSEDIYAPGNYSDRKKSKDAADGRRSDRVQSRGLITADEASSFAPNKNGNETRLAN